MVAEYREAAQGRCHCLRLRPEVREILGADPERFEILSLAGIPHIFDRQEGVMVLLEACCDHVDIESYLGVLNDHRGANGDG